MVVRIVQTLNNRIAILRTKGVATFVGIRGVGVPIPDDQIEYVQTVLAQGIRSGPHAFPGKGKRVRLRGGSLDGMEEILGCQARDKCANCSLARR